jgi:hypothetical protein
LVQAVAKGRGALLATTDPLEKSLSRLVESRIFPDRKQAQGTLIGERLLRSQLGQQVGNQGICLVTRLKRDLLNALTHLGTNPRMIPKGQRNGGV